MNRSRGVKSFTFNVRYSDRSVVPVTFDARTKQQAGKIARSLYGNKVEAVKESDR